MTTSPKLRVLVVDDDRNSREGLSLLLGMEGHAVDTSATAALALARLAATPYDVLLTDYVMPGMSGLELVRAARAERPALRCFIMSGHPPSGEVLDCAWIDKPIDIDRLLAEIAPASR